MSPELRAELENLVFSVPNPYLSLDNRLAPFLDIVERAVAAERARCAQVCRDVGDGIDSDTDNSMLMTEGVTAYALAQRILDLS